MAADRKSSRSFPLLPQLVIHGHRNPPVVAPFRIVNDPPNRRPVTWGSIVSTYSSTKKALVGVEIIQCSQNVSSERRISEPWLALARGP
jgi:hypothetical protein